MTFTLKDRTADETITVTPADKSLVKTKIGKWKGDKVNVAFTPKKDATTTVTVKCGDESIELTLIMRKSTLMTSEEIYSYTYDSCVEIKTWDSEGKVYIGAGFFVGPGEVLTDYHVVSSASKMTITDYKGKEYTIKSITGYSVEDDLILIKTAEKNKTALSLATDIKGGMKMYSFGSPAGVTASFSTGLVSNPKLILEGIKYFQATIPSGIGSGGGPMVNEYGQVLGIMTLTVSAAQNMNFGIRYDVIRNFLENITDKSVLSLKAFYKENEGKLKDSNDYGIFEKNSEAVESAVRDADKEELSPEQIYELAHDAMVDIAVAFEDGAGASGSGFFIDKETIVTCAHVVSHGKVALIEIADYNGNKYSLTDDIRISTEFDVALITVKRIKGKSEHTSLAMAPGYLPLCGESVYAFGSPAGYSCTFSGGMALMPNARLSEFESTGLGISTDLRFIAFSAPITTGSSGGVLLNKYGEAIGITSGVINVTENLNLAIQIEQIKKAN